MVFWGLVAYFVRGLAAWPKFIMSVIIIIFMTLPSVTSITFSVYNCVNVFNDNNTYLAIDLSEECWVGNHAYYAKEIGIPIIIIWIVGLPLVALAILIYHKK